MINHTLVLLSLALVATRAAQTEPQVTEVHELGSKLYDLPVSVHGRAVRTPAGIFRQWPGTYFETSFVGNGAYFKVGEGDAILHVIVDGKPVRTLVKPAEGAYRLHGLTSGPHKLRIEVANESQAEPSAFGGFYRLPSVKPQHSAVLTRQIEFIGDSYTVGYGNQSRSRKCTEDEIWKTTDTSNAFGPLLAKRLRADYQVNAISGRGVVRNYGGFQADTMPVAHAYSLFDHGIPYRDPSWQPGLIVISLGTNDFSTPLKPGERWRTREELRADYEKSYVKFIQQLRMRNPRVFFILWMPEVADGEAATEARRVYEKLHSTGETRVSFLLVPGLSFSGCNHHPSLADDRIIAERMAEAIEAQAPFGR